MKNKEKIKNLEKRVEALEKSNIPFGHWAYSVSGTSKPFTKEDAVEIKPEKEVFATEYLGRFTFDPGDGCCLSDEIGDLHDEGNKYKILTYSNGDIEVEPINK